MTDLSGAPRTGTAESRLRPHGARYDVAVLIEGGLSAASARRLMAFYDMKSEPVHLHVVRPVGKAGAENGGPRAHAETQLQQTIEKLAALQAEADGVVTGDPPAEALDAMVSATGSQEAIVVTSRHLVASLLRRDWASQVRETVDVPVTHLTVSER